jgi:hypothetical protein
VILEGGKVHQDAALSERRHPIANGFFCLRCRLPHYFPDFFENWLNFK